MTAEQAPSASASAAPAPASPAPVPVRDAATVVLLRDGAEGLQTWLMRRVRAMVFAADMTVFPGGSVDPRDGDIDVPWSGPGPDYFAGLFGSSEVTARELVTAAARETFEETGVLLTDPAPAYSPRIAAARRAVESRELPFSELLAQLGCALHSAALRPWSRWITPPSERRRFDTRFFVAAFPDDAVADGQTSEAAAAEWVPIARALAECEAGLRPMLAPTISTLGEIAAYDTVDDVLGAARAQDLTAIAPRKVVGEDEIMQIVARGRTYFLDRASRQGRPA